MDIVLFIWDVDVFRARLIELPESNKSFVKPEIYLLLLKGFKPRDLIKVGVKASTVYAYSARLPEIQMRLKDLQKKLKVMK